MLLAWLLSALLTLPSTVKPSTVLHDISTHLKDYRLPGDIAPVSYDLELIPYLQEGYFSGHVWINVTCEHATSSIVLHAHGDLNVSRVAVYVDPLSDNVVGREIEVKHVERDVDKEWFIIMLTERLRKQDSYRIHLIFNGNLDNGQLEGLYRRKVNALDNNRTQWYAATNMMLNSARRIFPCFDEPEYKAVFDVKVGTTARQHVFTMTPLAEIIDMPRKYGWYWKHFMKSPPLSTRSFGLFMFEFEHYSLSKGILRVVGRASMKTAVEKLLEDLDQAYEFFVDYLGIDAPLPKLDLVIVPDNVRLETSGSFGLIAMSEEYTDHDTLQTAGYLIIGQWISHLITPQWWGELDVSFGLMYQLAQNFLYKKNSLNVWEHYSLYYEYARIEPFKTVASQRDSGTFERASWFLHMMQYAITEDTFITALRKFLQMRLYSTFSEHDLFATLTEHAWSEHTLPKDVLIEDVAKSWLTKERYPVVTVTRDYRQNTATVQQHTFLKNKFYRVEGVEHLLWYIPIMYLTPDNLNVSSVRPAAWMKNQRMITINNLPQPQHFIIVNPAEIGMFMVNYDQKNWQLISDALQRKLIPTAEIRAKLLHDAWNLAFSGELSFNSAMDMTLFLKDETDYDVWTVMSVMLDHVGRFLDGTSVGDKFKRYVMKLADSAMDHLGSMRWSQDHERNVYNMLKYMVKRTSSKKHTQTQRELFEAWARGNGDYSSKTMESLCQILKHGSLEDFDKGLHRLMEILRNRKDAQSSGPTRLFCNCAKQFDKIERLLAVTFLGQNTGFTDKERNIIINQLTGFYAGYNTMFYFVKQNWDALKQALQDKPDLWVELLDDAMTVFKTEDKLIEVAKFYAEKKEDLGNAAPVIQAGIEQMTANAQWTNANVPELESWLDKHLPAQDKNQEQ